MIAVLIGLCVGILSGIVGIGGGIFLVPALTFFFKLSHHSAQGTSLALLVLPLGVLGAWTYYKAGYVDMKLVLLIAIGFLLGSLFGAKIALIIPEAVLKKIFGILLIGLGIKFFF